jgi:hypothetical protein
MENYGSKQTVNNSYTVPGIELEMAMIAVPLILKNQE